MQDTALQSLIDAVRAAAASATPLRIRGGGTKDFHGQRLHGQVLEISALGGIVSYEPSELVVTVRGGTPLAELEGALAEQGQCLPFEPPRFRAGGTVGGMVAAGLSGPARASVGAVRDYVLGLKLLNGRGELLTFGGQVMKNVAGYDVSRLMAGAWGTLGVITEVSLKVLPVAPMEATLRFRMRPGRGPAAAQRLGWAAAAAQCKLLGGRRRRRRAVPAPARCAGGGRRGLPHPRRRASGQRRCQRRTGTPAATSNCPGSRIALRPNACGACRCRRRRRCWHCPPRWARRWWSGMAASAGSRRARPMRWRCGRRRRTRADTLLYSEQTMTHRRWIYPDLNL